MEKTPFRENAKKDAEQARSQAWANPGSARVAQKTARVAQIVKMYEIDILTLEKG